MTHATFFYSIFSFFGIFRVISLNRSLSTIRLLSLLSYFAFSERVILNRIAKIPVHAVIVPSLETMQSFLIELLLSIERGESLARSGAIFYPNFWIRRQKKEKRKNVLFFRFCNGERVSIGNISRGKVGQPRRNG